MSRTAELLFDGHLKLYTLDFIFTEFFKYKESILKKTHRREGEYIQIMHDLQDVCTVVPQEGYLKFMKQAKRISPDEKDVMYFALALKLKCGIWTNDKKLKEQKAVDIYSTEEVNLIVKA